MSRAKILIVDDEIIIARELEARLTGLGYDVPGIASSGTEAIELALEAQPDLVLMDISLRGYMDGIEAADEIRRRLSIPIIFVTAFADEKTLGRAKVTEPFGYIVKPFGEQELLASIEVALYKDKVERKLRDVEKWFNGAMWGIAEGVIATQGTDGTISFINPMAEDLTGWSSSEVIGRNVDEIFCLVSREGRTKIPDPAARILTECIVTEINKGLLLITRTGEEIPIDYTGTCMRDAEGRPSGVMLIFRDASAQAQVKVLQSQIQLTQVGLDAARAIQQHLFPEQAPQLSGFEIAGSCQPSEATGGDYFDFVPMAGGRLGVVVADVSSHGFGPALIMASTRRALRTIARRNSNPGSVLTLLNEAVCEDTDPERFVTLFLACLDPSTQQMLYAAAGHAAYLFDTKGRVSRLESTGFPLGIMNDTVYSNGGPLQLQPGELVLLLTDGFNEAIASDDRAFGLASVFECVSERREQSANEILNALIVTVRGFCYPAIPHDDLTAVVIKRL